MEKLDVHSTVTAKKYFLFSIFSEFMYHSFCQKSIKINEDTVEDGVSNIMI